MCGIVGIFSQERESVAAKLFDSLMHLQHRGQDAAGILTYDPYHPRFYHQQGTGLVRDIFDEEKIGNLPGNIGIAHTRYPTAGGYSQVDIQPLWIGSPRGIALAHNGNLSNYQELAHYIRTQQHQHLNSNLDSEVLLLMFADQLAKNNTSNPDENTFFSLLCKAVQHIFHQVQGAYSVVSVVIGQGLIAFRDPHGIRPLVLGSKTHPSGNKDFIIASESTPFFALGYKAEGEIQPGEVVWISQSGTLYRRIIEQKSYRPCVFEDVYFARPDASDGEVYRARVYMGENLAQQWLKKYPQCLPDVVIPVPSTANTAALQFARILNVPYREGLYKNPFVGRTFIMPNQKARTNSIRYKLSPQSTEIAGKSILLVDDSIVRGNTSREIIKMIRELGAKKIYLVSTCPPIKFPCFYGIDIPSAEELIAADKSVEEIAHHLGVDALMYQTEPDLIEAVARQRRRIAKPCLACMDGDYLCSNMTADKMSAHAQQRKIEKNKHFKEAMPS